MALGPKYAFHFTANASDNIVWAADIKTPNFYRTAGTVFGADAGSAHNKVMFPHGGGFTVPPLLDAGNNVIWWDDVGNALGLTLQAVNAIGTTNTPAKTLRGSVSITGAATTAAVTFTEADASYFVTLGARNAGGTPAAGSLRASASGILAAGFTVNLEVAPGVGNTVRVDWMLVR